MTISHAKRRAPAGRIAYVDGRYLPHPHAAVHIEDRGLQFADSVYEVFAVTGGALLDEDAHLKRLARSLGELGIAQPLPPAALSFVMREVVRRNRLRDGLIYVQVTRGSYARDHVVPKDARGTVIVTARRLDPAAIEARRSSGVKVKTEPDIRWGRCDIKATALLPNVLAKTEARRAGAYEAWLVDRDGKVTEGTSTNAWIVDSRGRVVTRVLSNNILAGVTRSTLMRAAAAAGLTIEERSFTVEDARQAREAFVTSATGGVIPVVEIDGIRIGDGVPGSTTLRMHALYRDLAQKEARISLGFASQSG
jgi:D-alanine transaminase